MLNEIGVATITRMGLKARRHSEDVLSDRRDRWWNDDFLVLQAERLGLTTCQQALDVGCGQGHWGQRLLPLLAADAHLEGVDLEVDWAMAAQERAWRLGFGERTHYRASRAESLPFPNAHFDLVTCQTLLMHLADPDLALDEFLRVLRPGGLVLLAEPSNLANQFDINSVSEELSPREWADLCHLLVACSRGRAAAGRGDDSIGDRLPQLLAKRGLDAVHLAQNERPSMRIPPYSQGDRADLAEELGHYDAGFWLWNRDDAAHLFKKGGGGPKDFPRCYQVLLHTHARMAEQVANETYWRTGAGNHYLISARKPSR